ncbi:unnamed protein product [Nippostrongylus brasiliensis]|uniref:Reverse transcriptase domain-containing protein n=1 Tax=Nippostrongylus brasiliensis TaxID=27835 RepID=A0A0N4XRS3_NIPBR|nr:unnamed protein product [Nippostrongylus brasiliensis]
MNISIEKDVKQGDTILPKLFTVALQWVMKSLDGDEKDTRVDRKFLSNHCVADDIVIFAEAETML